MENIMIELPDGNKKEFPINTSAKDVAASIAKSLEKKGIAAKWNGEMIDYTRPLKEDGYLEIITKEDEEGLDVLRHSAAHIMAQAIKRLHPDVHFGVGPTIENGFYYDTDMEEQLTESDLPAIEKEMMEIVKANYPFERKELTRKEAL
ncbi:MAG: TGS domain-containing protein, partial [Atopostipes suicloacalis]|nr:TGS domain-containing protein [Atopostipes suicloacalis]